MRYRTTARVRLTLALAAATILASGGQAQAQISYSVTDSVITENFDSLPTDLPNNGNIETVYTDGWKDNSTTTAGLNIGLPGWYLYHPTSPGSENGFNGNQRVRSGPGANTGAFWLFADTSSTPDKSMGSVGATTIAPNSAEMLTGMRLVNTTGQTLTGFTVTYDGEQWRDGQAETGETLLFDYSLSASEASWNQAATMFSGVATLNFTSPVVSGNATAGAGVNGNVEGLVPNVSGTVTGIAWAPGQELWLRWKDPQLAGLGDDGLSIDNVRFTAGLFTTNPTDIASVMSGLASAPATWSNNQAPSSTNTYRVVSGHTVTVDAPFAGTELRANSGGTVNFGTAGSAKHVPLLVIDDGGNLTENAAGDFALGDINQPALGTLVLNNIAPVGFNIDAGGNFYVDMKVTGGGDVNFSGGAGSKLWLSDTSAHLGTIRFNGSGDRVMMTQSNSGVGTLEMNSTGANTLYFDPEVQSDQGSVVFNQPGTIDHAATVTAPTRRRLHGVHNLTVNAPVVLDLSKGFPDSSTLIDERRFLVRDTLEGNAALTINGMAVDPTNPNTEFGTSLNEFELGSSGDVNPPTSGYSGVMTANGYVNVEVRHNLANARVVVNNNAHLDTGLQTVPAVVSSLKTIQIGEVEVNNGGILEVGFEQGVVAGSPFFVQTGHHVGHLDVTASGARDGALTLNDGATLRMQVNGLDDVQFDRITASDVALNGTLNILVNPPSTSAATANPVYFPAVGDTFNLITLSAGSAGPGDFNDSGAVDGVDLGVWQGGFGPGAAGDADSDGDTDGNDFLVWQRNLGTTGGGGDITGDFDSVVVTDPTGAMSGFNFQVVKTATAVQLVVVAAIAAIPEPSTITLCSLAALTLVASRRRR